MDAPTLSATILEIQRMSTEDGPGLRTTVFFKGCSLRCAWCHNPESLSGRPQLQWVGSRCIGCHLCLAVCKNGALSDFGKGIAIDRKRCQACGACAQECPSTSLELLGKTWTLHDLLAEVLKDRAYFAASQGGITASGGEAALQPAFVAAFFKELQSAGIHTALDTCGQVGAEALARILPHTDLVLFDLKEMDGERHRRFTGQDNATILHNLETVRESMARASRPTQLWIRTPIIPDATANAATVRAIGEHIAQKLNGAASRWDLCAFNNLCRDKYTRLGMEWAYARAELVDTESMESLARTARESGVDPAIVQWSGATRER